MTFVLPDIRISLVGPLPVTRQFTVSGIFESGTDADKTQVYVAIDDLRRIQKRHGLEGFRLLTSDLFASQDTIRELITTGRHELFGAELAESPWKSVWCNSHAEKNHVSDVDVAGCRCRIQCGFQTC